MEYNNFNNIYFAKMLLLNQPCLLTDKRINKESIPDDLYMYEIAHSNDNKYDPVFVSFPEVDNFYGTIVCKDEINISKDGFVNINMDSSTPDLRYLCHDVVFGQDYQLFFDDIKESGLVYKK